MNAVGVDVNTASAALLTRVSGLSSTVAENIVVYRDQHGAFPSRKALLKVPRLGDKTFEQCAGFLRIADGEFSFDNRPVQRKDDDDAVYRTAREKFEGVVKSIRATAGASLKVDDVIMEFE